MTENEVLEMLLGIKEIQVDRFEVQDQHLHIYCSSIFQEALCPHCLKKRQVINQTYLRQFRDLPIAGKEVYLYLSQRQFYCPDCDRHFSERFNFVDVKRMMTRRYERHVYECCKASTIQKISAQENLVWQTVNEICQRGARKELEERPVSKVRAVGMDEFAMKKGHRDYATVIVDLERVEIIDILEYRKQEKLIEYFKSRGMEWCEGIGSSRVLVELGEPRIGYEANPLIWKAVRPMLSRLGEPNPARRANSTRTLEEPRN